MRSPQTDASDRKMMTRCIALSVRSAEEGEYPYGVVIRKADQVVSESINRVAHEHDVTRHAEVVAISRAQKLLCTTSLDDCIIYANAEPCAFCSYAIRESRIKRVVYGLRSPHMGGVSKWNVLTDEDLSDTMPEVFAPPPEIIAGFMSHEAEQALLAWNPLIWEIVRRRGLFGVVLGTAVPLREPDVVGRRRLMQRFMALLRRTVFDRFGRNSSRALTNTPD